ncbi:MAG: aspartate carbamoyltransferase [Kiritimatiellae bacterium]|nr:aspartate carbamoyltransferase [Kiritimatiellia bacterium]
MPSWEELSALPPEDKAKWFSSDGRLRHALMAQQFDRALLDRLCELSTRTRRIAKTKGGRLFLQNLLSDRRAMLYFAQPSTRTFLSFYAACQIIGLQPAEVRDTQTSSELKGESPEDSVRTFSSYVDLIIMRHPMGGFAERVAWMLSQTNRCVPVINAGSGKDQHPTQALLDIYTLAYSFAERGGIEGKTIAFVGDLKRGRTARSLSWLLTRYSGVRQIFCAPDALQIGPDVRQSLDAAGAPWEMTDDFEDVVARADAIYMTRLQDEWDQHGESRAIDVSRFRFRAEHLARLRPDAVLLHPLPRRDEIAVEVDRDPRAVYWRQVRNGMWIRAALMLWMFDKDGEINEYYEDLMG